jgi:hypothetical protein
VRINKSLITFTPTSGSGSGTVTSVALSAPTGFVVTGSPITSSGTLAITFASGYSLPTTTKQGQWDTAYNRSLTAIGVSGTTTKTITLTKQDGTTLTANFTDTITSVFGRTGAIVAVSGDYTTTLVTEGTNLYYTEARVNANANVAANTAARHNAVTLGTANGLSLSTQVLSLGLSSNSTTGALSSTDWLAFSSKQPAITLTTSGSSGSSTLVGATLNVPTYTLVGLGGMSNPFSAAIGQLIYSNSAGAPLSLLGNTTTTKKFLSQTGDGTNSAAPFWSTIAIGDVSGAISLTALSATSPLLYNNSTGVFSIQQASNLQSGFLSDANWTTFNSKQTQITLTTTGSSGASTFNFSTGALNIPEYTLAGLGGLSNPMTSLGDMIYANGAGAPQRLAPNTTTTRKYLSMLGDGTSGAIPTWETITGIAGSGTTNYIAKFTAASTIGNSLIYDNGTNVGIGTATPLGKLDVQGLILGGNDSATAGSIILQDQYGLGHLLNIGTNRSSGGVVLGYGVYPSGVSTNAFISSTSIDLERGALSFDGSFRWYTGTAQTVSIGTGATLSEKMILSNTGNVGIGTSTLGGRLTVNAAVGGTSLYATDTTNSTFYITHPSVNRTSFYNGSATRWLTEVGGNLGLEGNVIVGGTSPSAKFHVSGGGLAIAGSGLMVAAQLTNGRLETYDAGSLQAIHTYFDSHSYELSAGSTAGYVSGLVVTGRGATLLPDRVAIYTRSVQRLQVGGLGQLSLNAYTSLSSFTGTPVGYLAFDSSGNIITSNPTSAGRNTRITFSAEVPNTWLTMPSALTFFDNSTGYVTQADLTAYNQVRLIVNKQGTAGAASSKIILRYQLTSGAPFTASSYSDIGTSEVSVAVNVTNNILITSWIDMATAAKDDVWVTILGIDGDGTVSPQFGNIYAEFRFN